MTTVRMRLLNPEGTDRNGNLILAPGGLEWQDIPYLPLGSCEHQETACRECLDIWENDWEIDLDTVPDFEQLAGEADPDVDDDEETEIVPAGAWGVDIDGYEDGEGDDDDW